MICLMHARISYMAYIYIYIYIYIITTISLILIEDNLIVKSDIDKLDQVEEIIIC
jgi:hypothetical protein